MTYMSLAKVLIVDDDESIRSALRLTLTDAGYETYEACDGLASIAVFESMKPDLVILDIMMPRLDGLETCLIIRRSYPQVPVLFLSAKGDISDKKAGFHSGADDYLTKPFSPEELVLRVEALLRRSGLSVPEASHAADAGDCHIDLLRREVSVRGQLRILTPKEFKILATLAEVPGKVCTREEITEKAWGIEYRGTDVGVPTHIRHIREKIEDDPANPRYLQTIGRLGYRFGD